MTPNFYRKLQPMTSYIRVLHASPNSPAVDIYANDGLIMENLAYGKISQYIPVTSNDYNIKVFPTGDMTTAVIDTDVFIPENTVFTVAAIGTLPNISLFPVQEPPVVQNTGNACVRFVHLSPNAPAVDIQLANGTVIFDNVPYKGVTNYICTPPGVYNLNVVPTGTNDIALSVPGVELDANTYYTIYAIGLVADSPALQALLITEPRE